MRVSFSGLVAAFLVFSVTGTAQAQLTCADLDFDEEATTAYPQVNEACLEVLVRDGANFARFHARVLQPGSGSIVLQYEHRDGTWGEPQTVTLPEDFRFIIDGRPTPTWDLEMWQELNIYLREGRWRLAITDLAPVETLETYPEPLPQIASPEVVVPDPPEAAVEPEPEPEAAPVEQPLEAEQPEEGGYLLILGLFGALILILVAVFLKKRQKA